MRNTIHNQKHLKPIRRELRNNGTSAEAVLWDALKNRQLQGRKFRRQHSIESFIVDFYCAGEQLVVELDGYNHLTTGGQEYDLHRDARLKELGLLVLRFENKFVFKNLGEVLEEIVEHFGRRR